MNSTPPKTSIRVISLADATERRQAFSERFALRGFEWSFFDAHRNLNSALGYSERDAWISQGRPLTPQELGCYSSHYSIWEEFLASDAQQLMVFEDDALADVDYLRREIITTDFAKAGVHLLRLYGGFPSRCALRGRLYERRVFQLLSYTEGAVCYLITRQGAKQLVAHSRQVMRPIDDVMDRSWAHGVSSFGLFPYPVMELQVATQIPQREDKRKQRNPYLLQRYRYRIMDKIIRLSFTAGQLFFHARKKLIF